VKKMNNKQDNLNNLINAKDRLEKNEHTVYFLVYDTKNNARAAIKYIYDSALFLKESGINTKVLVESNNYTKINFWLGDRYKDIEVLSIKDNEVRVQIEDIVVIPEAYSNMLEQFKEIRCTKVMLVQKEYMFETLPIGSRWSDFGITKVITTSKPIKDYISSIFPESLIYVNPPVIGDNFKPSEKLQKPFIAINCRDRAQHKKIISEFYIKNPHLRWFTFRDMIQMTYDEFSEKLSECIISVWIDDESTFGTFPLESMKCNVPVVGKVPFTEPEWMKENGMWTYDNNKIVDILGTYITGWLEGISLSTEVKTNMYETVLPYNIEIIKENTVKIFESLKNSRLETLTKTIEQITKELK
jgi:hypothetical protein